MAYEKPNYTQTPNLFFDTHLPEIRSLSELKITLVVLRNTLGWHAKEAELTISDLITATGLSNRHVIRGAALALERGTIRRRAVTTATGKTYAYEANILASEAVTKGHRVREGVCDQKSPQKVTKSPAVLNRLKKVKESKDLSTAIGYKQVPKTPEEKTLYPPETFSVTDDLRLWVAEMQIGFSDERLAELTTDWMLSRHANGQSRGRTLENWKSDWKRYVKTCWEKRATQRNENGHQQRGFETAAERNRRNLRESLKRAGLVSPSGD
jgi:hypothetical protein